MNNLQVLKDIENTVLLQHIKPLKKIKFSELDKHFDDNATLGVYFIFNEKNELIYIGQSGANKKSNSNWGLKNRINQHQTKSDTGAKNFGVSVDIVKNNYSFSYIQLTDKTEIKELEIFFIGIFSRILKFNKYHIIKRFKM